MDVLSFIVWIYTVSLALATVVYLNRRPSSHELDDTEARLLNVIGVHETALKELARQTVEEISKLKDRLGAMQLGAMKKPEAK